MIEVLWILLISVCMIMGVVGSVLPILPGPPLAFLGMLIYKFCPLGENLSWWLVAFGAIITLLSVLAEYYAPIFSTKRYGGTKYGAIGAAVGIIVGLFLPFGFLYGPFVGAFIGELINDSKNHKKALKASWGSFLGFFVGIGINIAVCGILMTIVYLHLIFFR